MFMFMEGIELKAPDSITPSPWPHTVVSDCICINGKLTNQNRPIVPPSHFHMKAIDQAVGTSLICGPGPNDFHDII